MRDDIREELARPTAAEFVGRVLGAIVATVQRWRADRRERRALEAADRGLGRGDT